MVNRIFFLLISILFLSAAALGQGTAMSSDYKSLEDAVAKIGAAPTTLVISTADFPSTPATPVPTVPTTVPSTLILEFRGLGTLSLQPGHHVIIQSEGSAWPIRKIFNNANAAPTAHDVRGPVSFSGNKSMREISISWWGALCDNSANDTDAINAALVAGSGFTVTTPANVVCRVGRTPPAGHPEIQSPYLQSNTVLRLGANSMFKVSDSAPDKSAALAMRDCEYCTVDGGVFDGNSDDAAPAGHPAPASSFAVLIYGGKCLKLLNGRSQYARAPRENGEVKGNAGDGIYLGIGQDAPQDVIVDKWTSTDNERQAISIIGCLQCRFTNNYFLNTRFAVEGAGMDFEPNPLTGSVGGLALTAGSREVASASAGFSTSDNDKRLHIQVGSFHTLISAVTDKYRATLLESSPFTATGPSGTIICSSGSRQVTNLYIAKDAKIVTSANESFGAADEGCQIEIGDFRASIEFKDPHTVKTSIASPFTSTGPSGATSPTREYRQITDLVLNPGSNVVISPTAIFTNADVQHQLEIGNFDALITEVRGNTAIVSLASTQTVIRGTATIRSFEDSRQVNHLVLTTGSDVVTSPSADFTGPRGPRRLKIGDFDALITQVNGQNSVKISKPSPLTATSASGTITSIRDLRQVTNVSIRAGSNELVSPTAIFTNADVGRQIKMGDFEAYIKEVRGDTAIISINSPFTNPSVSGIISTLSDSRQVTDLVIKSGEEKITSETANFTEADRKRQIQIGNFYAAINRVINPNTAILSRKSPLTAARASGTISSLVDARQVDNLVIQPDGLITSATPSFAKTDENRQIQIGEYYAVIELFKEPQVVRVLVGSHGSTGTITNIRQRYEDMLVEGNTISGNAGPGILFSNKNGAPYKGIQFVNNSIRNNLRSGLWVTSYNTDGLIIAHNTIEGNGPGKCEDAGQPYGLVISGIDRGASVVGNTIANNDCSGIFISAASHVTLADNKIYRNGRAGILIRTDTNLSVIGANSVIHGNSIFNNGTETTITPTSTADDYARNSAGIVIGSRADKNAGWEIANNMFGNDAIIFPTATQQDGIYFQSASSQGIIVGPNTYAGLLGLNVRTLNPVLGEDFRFNPTFSFGKWEANKPRSLVFGFGNNGSSDAVLPADSTQGFFNIPATNGRPTGVPSNPTPGGVVALTGDKKTNRFCWNVDGTSTWQCAPGSLTATKTLDFPWISANTSSELTIPVTGAAIGDVCFASPSTTLESGLSFSCYISSNNTATVRLGNVTTGRLNPVSQSWKVGVWKF